MARVLEENDISTVTLNMFEEVAYQVKAPRTILTKFELGAPFGEPGNKELHLKVIEECLNMLENTREAGRVVEI